MIINFIILRFNNSSTFVFIVFRLALSAGRRLSFLSLSLSDWSQPASGITASNAAADKDAIIRLVDEKNLFIAFTLPKQIYGNYFFNSATNYKPGQLTTPIGCEILEDTDTNKSVIIYPNLQITILIISELIKFFNNKFFYNKNSSRLLTFLSRIIK